jgi:hypothetical protein
VLVRAPLALADAWWSFAQADRVVLGLVVTVLAGLAVTYLAVRLARTRGRLTARRAVGRRGRA